MTKYREYDARYQELQAKVDALEAEKRNRQGRVKRFEVFIQALKKQQGELSDFDDDTWLAVIETVLVRPDGKLVFRFANGLEVEQYAHLIMFFNVNSVSPKMVGRLFTY